MPLYQIVVERGTQKSLAKVPAHVRTRLVRAIDKLAEDPRPHGLKTIDAEKKVYRIRVGDYRVVYQIQDAQLVVMVIRIGDRKEVYRRLDDLMKRTPPPE